MGFADDGGEEREQMSLDEAMPNGSSFFRNVDCAYFPCHAGVDEGSFNCLFCYCPLYALGPACGGTFSYTASGIKDCSACTRLHDGDAGVAIVRGKFAELARLAAMTDASRDEE
jgi:Zn-finger protein